MGWSTSEIQLPFEYQKGWDNTVADVLSQITTHLSPKAVQSTLDGVTLGTAFHREEGHDPTVVEGDHSIEKEVQVAAGWVQVEMHVTDWAAAQKEDPVLNTVLSCLETQKKTNLRTLLGEHAFSEDGQMVWQNCQNTECPLPMLHAQRGEWGSITLHGPESTLSCHSQWVPSRCQTPRLWPYLVLTTRTLLVARDGQPGETIY